MGLQVTMCDIVVVKVGHPIQFCLPLTEIHHRVVILVSLPVWSERGEGEVGEEDHVEGEREGGRKGERERGEVKREREGGSERGTYPTGTCSTVHVYTSACVHVHVHVHLHVYMYMYMHMNDHIT